MERQCAKSIIENSFVSELEVAIHAAKKASVDDEALLGKAERMRHETLEKQEDAKRALGQAQTARPLIVEGLREAVQCAGSVGLRLGPYRGPYMPPLGPL